ncbi:MAG: sulfatase [Cyclobacteriaceae bacterium]
MSTLEKFYKLFTVFILILTSSCNDSVKEVIDLEKMSDPNNPNILILYVDDLGWSDLGCYGNQYHDTPYLDSLAKDGLKFTQAYAPAPICSASRASFLTGKSPAKLNFEFAIGTGRVTDRPLLPPLKPQNLPAEETTFAEIAKKGGYRTAMYGKWHIAEERGGYLKWHNKFGPFQQGFDEGSDHYGSHTYDGDNQIKVNLEEGVFPEDRSVKEAIQFINEANDTEPFLLFFSSYYVHTPIRPNNTWLIEKYQKKMMGHSDNEINYAVFVETMDYYFGQVLQALKNNGIEDNTIVLFTSDNGGHPKYTDNFPLKGNKWNLYEGGVREPFIVRWPDKVTPDSESNVPIIGWDVLPTIAEIVNVDIPKGVDGQSLLGLFLGQDQMNFSRRTLDWHFPFYHPPLGYEGTKPCSSILKDGYKLIYFYEDNSFELYNIDTDLSEANNLASVETDLAQEMKDLLLNRLEKVNARFPMEN